jgi:hypothetical protein
VKLLTQSFFLNLHALKKKRKKLTLNESRQQGLVLVPAVLLKRGRKSEIPSPYEKKDVNKWK